MGKHHAISKRTRNVAVAGTTFAAATGLLAPVAGANPLNDALGQFGAPVQDAIGQLPSTEGLPALPGGNGSKGPALQSAIPTSGAAQSVGAGQRIVAAARSKIGSPYVWGAEGPNSFDCSGLTSWAYAQVGKSIPRTSQAQSSEGIQVSPGAELAGDIIAFYGGATHVGIYSGGGNVIHAPQSGDVVKEVPMSYMPYHNAVRF